MTVTQLKQKIDSILAAYPDAAYITANHGILYVFTDGVTKPATDADIRIDVSRNKMWLLEGVSL